MSNDLEQRVQQYRTFELPGQPMATHMGTSYLTFVFVAGWGWGQWWAERTIRAERSAMDKGRLTVAMPVKPDDAAATMRLLADLIEQAEREKDGAAHAR